MSSETVPLEQLPLELPPDTMLANMFVWHGMQVYLNQKNAVRVQPYLDFGDPLPTGNEADPPTPVEVTYHPDKTFPTAPDDPPWAYQKTYSAYPGHEAVIMFVGRAQHNLPAHVAQHNAVSPLIPEAIVSIAVHNVLPLTHRTDLDDAERRYLQRTDYHFFGARPAVRQDIFDIGEPKKHAVAVTPPHQELRRLHDQLFSASCVCGICVLYDHYGPLGTLPQDKLAILRSRIGRA